MYFSSLHHYNSIRKGKDIEGIETEIRIPDSFTKQRCCFFLDTLQGQPPFLPILLNEIPVQDVFILADFFSWLTAYLKNSQNALQVPLRAPDI